MLSKAHHAYDITSSSQSPLGSLPLLCLRLMKNPGQRSHGEFAPGLMAGPRQAGCATPNPSCVALLCLAGAGATGRCVLTEPLVGPLSLPSPH